MSRIKTDNMVFVFGSNLKGIHGGGAARFAYTKRGAVWGQGIGRFGQSYALPTKEAPDRGATLSLTTIRAFVDAFLIYAKDRSHTYFQVTCIGCGLAGLEHKDIAPMFLDAPSNCYFDTLWEPYLGSGTYHYWGTF